MHHKLIAAALCAGLVLPAAARADEASDLAAMRAEMKQMQKDYIARMAAMEKRLSKTEAELKAAKQGGTAKPVAAATPGTTKPPQQSLAQAAPPPPSPPPPIPDQSAAMMDLPPSPPSAPPTSNNSFNPGIAAVLNGMYMAAAHDTSNSRIAGIAMGDEAGLPPRGFSIGESEISLAANIDPFLSGFLDISFQDDNSPTVEEAYIQTKDLGGGFTLKGGRFLSGIGYINERHAHDWLFSDAPLPYRAFLNNQYGDDGLQVRWLAPTDQFLEFGAEIFRGDAYPAAGARNTGMGTYTAFVHTGNDINDSSSWLAAASYLHSDAMGREYNDSLFNGRTDLGILSAVYKWAPGGNPTVRNLSLTTEIFYDQQSGRYEVSDGPLLPVNQSRWGGYVQGDYQFMPQWSFGLRYAMLGTDKVPLALTGTDLDDFGHTGNAETALLEFDTSEFGRFRAQYTHDEAGLKPNDEILFQFTVIYGPHGAHRY